MRRGIGPRFPRVLTMGLMMALSILVWTPMVSSKLTPNKYTRRNRKLSSCDNLIPNGNFEGSLTGWTTHDGGSLTLFEDSAVEDVNSDGTCLLVSGRTNFHHGPEHMIPTECFQEGSSFHFSSFVKLAINATENYQPYYCDRDLSGPNVWQDKYSCPILTFQMTMEDGKHFWAYGSSSVIDEWIDDQWNEFSADIYVTEKMSQAKEVKMYIERVTDGVDILLDQVVMKEHSGNLRGIANPLNSTKSLRSNPLDNTTEAEAEAEDDYIANCTHMVDNYDFEIGDSRGWSTRVAGKMLMYPKGFANSSHALLYTARSSPFAGPQHTILTECITEEKKYMLEAQIKLLDEYGDPYQCDKTKRYTSKSCPLLTLQYTTKSGKERYSYFENENLDVWQGDAYNWFYAEIIMTSDMKDAQDMVFYFERVKAGVSILFDNTHMLRDCEDLIPNGSTKNGTGSHDGWTPSHGNGWIRIQNRTKVENGVKTPYSYFIHHARGGSDEGPRQNIDPNCLVHHGKYEFSFQVKLTTYEGVEVLCDKNEHYGDNFCPLVSLALFTEDGNFELFNVRNRDSSKWKSGFNTYKGAFMVNDKIAKSKNVFFFIRGPKKEYDILFDNIEMHPYFPKLKTCDELIYNGDAEHGIEEWSVTDGGYLKEHEIGYDEKNGAISHYERPHAHSALVHRINPDCLIEGKHYVFRAQFKLLDEDGNPYVCVKDSDDDPCIIVSIYIEHPTGKVPVHLPNKSPHEWDESDWNVYRADFIINSDLADADVTELKIRGPRAGVSIIMDNASIQRYQKPTVNCQEQFIRNGDLENFDFNAWSPYGGKLDLAVAGAFGTKTAIMHSNRPSTTSGPRQSIETSCLIDTKRYQLTTHFKLLDENMFPFQCDHKAQWGSPDYCVVISLEYSTINSTSVRNFVSDVRASWEAEEWNFFHKIFTVDADLSIADSVILHVKGPRAGVSILMDQVNLHEYRPPRKSCNQLVKNSIAESEDFMAWSIINGGEFTFTTAGLDQTMAYKLKSRNRISSGMKQDLDMSCLTNVGARFEVNGLFQLLDEQGLPYACDKSKPWGDPLYCVIMSIKVKGSKPKHLGNNYKGDWVADDFNAFSARFIVTEDMAAGESAYFYFQGPRAGASIVFDRITITPVGITS